MSLYTTLIQMCTLFCPHDNWKQNRIYLPWIVICSPDSALHTQTHTCTTRVKTPPCIQILHHNLWNSTLALTFCSFPTAALPALCTRLSLTPSPAPISHSNTHARTHTCTHKRASSSPTSTLLLLYFSPSFTFPSRWLAGPHRSSPRLHVPGPGPVCFHSPPGGQVIWGRERQSRWPLAPDLFSLNLTPHRRVRRMWQSA